MSSQLAGPATGWNSAPQSTWARLATLAYLRAMRAGFVLFRAVAVPGAPARPQVFFPPTRVLDIPASAPTSPHEIRVHVYEPPAGARAGTTLAPIVISWHGSGFVVPCLGTHSRLCARLAAETGAIVIDADYRKGPEDPFPAGFDDARTVVDWVLSNPEGAFDTTRIAVIGHSAGGNFACAMAGFYPPGTFAGVVALYPAIDLSVAYSSKPQPPPVPAGAPAPIGMDIGARDGDLFFAAYAGAYPDLRDPRLSPALADPARFPDDGRTLIAACEYDWLGPEATTFANKLAASGRQPEYMFCEGMRHQWDALVVEGTPAAERRDRMYDRVVEVFRKAFA